MSTFCIVLAAIRGFLTPGTTAGAEIVSVVLSFVSSALGGLSERTKANVTRCIGVAVFALKWMHRVEDWIPAKWQKAYRETVEAVEAVVKAFADFEITYAEFAVIRTEFEQARSEWESDDEEDAPAAAESETRPRP